MLHKMAGRGHLLIQTNIRLNLSSLMKLHPSQPLPCTCGLLFHPLNSDEARQDKISTATSKVLVKKIGTCGAPEPERRESRPPSKPLKEENHAAKD